MPKVRQAFARTYFDELHEKVKDSKRLPTWIGELYFEFHRGTYTSMARNKRGNRKSEYAMMELELLSVLAENAGKAYPTEELNRMWETILTNQFHDILPGSSIHEVYEQTKKEYAEIAETSAELISERLNALCAKKDESVTVWNTLGHRRNDIVELGANRRNERVPGTADERRSRYLCGKPAVQGISGAASGKRGSCGNTVCRNRSRRRLYA